MTTHQSDIDDNSYHRVPVNSATTHKGTIDYNTITTNSSYNAWGRPLKRSVTTKYIDVSSLVGQNSLQQAFKDYFPRGKSRQRPINSADTRSNPRSAYMSLLPVDGSTVHSYRQHSSVSASTAKHPTSLPDVSRKSPSAQKTPFKGTVVNDENGDSKLYGRCATTRASGAWVRRYKSINASQTFTDLLRDDSYRDKLLFKKRSYQQFFTFASPSPSASPFNTSLVKSKRTTV